MMTDLWFRNADKAMAICAQEGVARLTWTRQHIARLKFDGINYVRQFYMHTAVRPKIMVIGIQGTGEYDMYGRITEPKAVYPTWSGKGDNSDDLLRMINEPWGEDKKKCEDLSLPSALRPVYGQKHRVIIHNGPPPNSAVGQRFWESMMQLQMDRPDVELFANGVNDYAVIFGLKFRAVDYGLSDFGDINQKVYLPNGRRIEFEKFAKSPSTVELLAQHEDWIKLLGFTPKDILVDQNKRFAFRIRSARWAAKHWSNNLRFFKAWRNVSVDEAEIPEGDYVAPETNRIVLRPKQFSLAEADKILCNRCRIQVGCRFYRADSICGLGDSEMAELHKFFDSRNAGRIIDGLAEITRMQALRLEATMAAESQGTEIDPNVDKQINALFANGKSLAKLVDPNLAGPGTKVQVNVGTGASGNVQTVIESNPKKMMANIVEALEMQGIPRDKITVEMISGVLKSMNQNSQQGAIEAQGIAFRDVMGPPQTAVLAHPVIIDHEDMEAQPVKRSGRE